ncbi:hypothetical protein HZ996_11635 [Cryomorphaceae bacterium]|nr:hypothetical protein HZ996_11635 [Cryomorphaceae bacterium]
MNLLLRILGLSLFLVFVTACAKDEDENPNTQSTSSNKILPLGASRVQGARPAFESYRYELWKDLKEGEWAFDFIGTVSDPFSYPLVDGEEFDRDHEGRGGWTSGQILNNLDDWLEETGSPDIVLFSSPGGNDALQGKSYDTAVQNVNDIIDLLQSDNPNVTIIIEQMAPGRSDIMTGVLQVFFNQMQQEVVNIAANQSTPESQVIVVDMFTGFDDSYLADEVHYNETGADFIASRYYSVLQTVLED